MGIRVRAFISGLVFAGLAAAAAPAPAWALIGAYLEPPPALPQSCRIVKKTDKGFESFCSSTQISADELLTAAHCFNDYDGYKDLFAECPGEDPRPIEVYFKQKNIDRVGQGAAVIRVKPPFKSKPVCMASSKADVAALVARSNKSTPKTCFYASYGLDTKGAQGNFHAAPAVSLSHSTDGQLLDKDGPAQHGDSGGSFFCLASDGRWLLTGITQGALISYHGTAESSTSHVDSIATVREWIDANTKGDRDDCEPRPA